MATTAKDTKSKSQPDIADYEDDIRSEMAQIKEDIAALTKAIGGYGKARASDLQDQAHDFSEEALRESRRALKTLGDQVTSLEKDMEKRVRENPLQWFLGALGLGMILAMILRRDS